MAITEELLLEGNAEDALNSAADAADAFADAIGDANAAAGEVDDAGFREVSAAVGDAIDSTDGWRDSIEDANSELKATEGAASGIEAVGEAFQSVNAALEVGKKVAQVVGKVYDLAKAFGSAVSEAKVWRDATKAALDQLTGGRGEQALASIAKQAQGLGVDTQAAVDQFTALRKAGASNADASALIALRADLEAVGVSSGDAEKAVKKALDGIKSGKDAHKTIADIAKGFGAVGDGANAAAKRSLTWAGAMKNAEGLGGRVFGVIAERAGPALDAVGAKITSVLDSFESSGAIEAFADGFSSALEALPPIIDAIMAGWDAFSEAVGPGVSRLSDAFGELGDALGGTDDGMSTATTIGTALGVAIGAVAGIISNIVSVVAAFVGALQTMGSAASAAGEMVTSALGAIADFSLADAGSALIQGFIDGILSMAGAVASAAAGVADAAAGAVKGALGIASPSKVGRSLGANLGESVGMGAEEAMPAEIAVPDFAPPANDVADVLPPMAGDAGAPTTSSTTNGGAVSIVQNFYGGGPDTYTMARRGAEDALQAAGIPVTAPRAA